MKTIFFVSIEARTHTNVENPHLFKDIDYSDVNYTEIYDSHKVFVSRVIIFNS